MTVGVAFDLVEFAESPRDFHARPLPTDPTPQIWWNQPTEAALVLGSAQRDMSIVDAAACRAAGVSIVRRRSGGGAVLLTPGEVTWLDVIIPTGAVDLGADIHAPMMWLGTHLAAAFAQRTERTVTTQGHAMVRTSWSSLVCFDGLGPGEVLLDGDKLVGISQRRTRAAARLQCCWYRSHDPAALTELLAVDHRPPVSALRPVATFSSTAMPDIPTELVRRLST